MLSYLSVTDMVVPRNSKNMHPALHVQRFQAPGVSGKWSPRVYVYSRTDKTSA